MPAPERHSETSGAARRAMERVFQRHLKDTTLPLAVLGSLAAVSASATAWSYRDEIGDAVFMANISEASPVPGSPSKHKMLARLEDETGTPLPALRKQQRRREAAERAEREGRFEMVKLEGFEKLRIRPESVKELLRASFPDSWIRASTVREIRVNPHRVLIHYPGLEDKEEAAHCVVRDDGGPAEIEITGMGFEYPDVKDLRFLLRQLLPHELAHANAPDSSPAFSTDEALAMQFHVVESVRDAGGARYAYPRAIDNWSPGRFAQGNKDRATEQYAMHVEDVFSLDGIDVGAVQDWDGMEHVMAQKFTTREADPRMAGLAGRWLGWSFRKADTTGTYKMWEAIRERERLEFKIEAEFLYNWFDDVAAGIRDEALGEELMAALKEHPVDLPRDYVVRLNAWTWGLMQEDMPGSEHFIQARKELGEGLVGASEIVVDAWADLVRSMVMVRRGHWESVGGAPDLADMRKQVENLNQNTTFAIEGEAEIRMRCLRYLDQIARGEERI